MVHYVTLLIVAILVLTVSSPGLYGDEFDTMRVRWEETMRGGSSYDPADPIVASKLAGITTKANDRWTSMNKGAGRTCLWDDEADGATQSGDVYRSYVRLKDMATGYRVRGSGVEGNVDLRDDIIAALDWLYANWYNETMDSPTWLYFEMGIPKFLADITVLMYDDLTPAQISSYMGTIQRFTPVIDNLDGSKMTGANRVSKVRGMVVHGIVIKNGARIAQARDALDQLFPYVTNGDGFRSDGSFVFHRKHPYNGGYGTSLLQHLSEVMFILAGSSWDVTHPEASNVFEWIHEGYQPVIWRGDVMDMYRGRTISFHNKTAINYGNALINGVNRLTPAAPPADQLAFKSMLKYWVGTNTFSDYFETCTLNHYLTLKAIMNDDGIPSRGDLVRYKQYPNMDRAGHFRPGWAFGISMHSNRIYNFESLGGNQNPRGWHTSDGMTYIYNNDQAQFAESFWCTVDMRRLPGTTISRNQSPPECLLSSQNWVGGVEWQGLYGATGMWLKPNGQTLSAKKSWFCFNDEVVALGSDIRSTDNQIAETIVENRRLTAAGGTNALVVNGSAKPVTAPWSESMTGVEWIHLAGNVPGSDIGYYFPAPAALEGKREERTGKWEDVNPQYPTDDIFTNTYVTLWFDHGYNPTDGSYQYVLLPNRSSAQVGAYAGNPSVIVLENSAAVHAVKEKNLNIVGANFWTDSTRTVDLITCNRRASVMVQDNPGSSVIAAVSDPTQVGSSVQIEIARKAYSVVARDPEISVTQLSPTIKFTVNVSGKRGKTFEVKFSTDPDDGPPPERKIGLIGWWKMDGNLLDSSPSKLHGNYEPSGSAGFSSDRPSAIESGQSLNLPGGPDNSDSSLMRAPDDPVLDTGNVISISHWIKTTRQSRAGTVCHDDDKSEYAYLFYFNNTGKTGFYVRGSGSAMYEDSTYADGRWHHVVGVYDRYAAERIKVYFDGVKVGAVGKDVAILDGDKGISIGRYWGNKIYNFQGKVDDVAIFNVALTPGQVQQLFNGNRTPGNVVPPTADPAFDSPPTLNGQAAVSSLNGEAPFGVAGSAAASDPDGDAITYAWVWGDGTSFTDTPPVGVASIPTHTFNAAGTYTVTVTASDESGGSVLVSWTVEVSENTPPVAQDQTVTTSENTSKAVVLNATDADGDVLTYWLVQRPSRGELTGTPPNLTYVPDADYAGTDHFTFQASDGTADSNVATVSVTIADATPPHPMNGLIGWWMMDGNLADASPSGLDGAHEPSGSAGFTSDRPSAIGSGQSLVLPGGADNTDSSRMRAPDDPVWDTGNVISISHWIKTTRRSRAGTVCHDDDSGEYSYLFYFNNTGKTSFYVRGSGSATYDASTYADGKWHHVVGVYDRFAAERIKIYFDGVKVGAVGKDVAILDGDKGISIGRYWGRNIYNFQGQVDDVAIFNVALTPEQVQQLRDGSRTPGNVVPSAAEAVPAAAQPSAQSQPLTVTGIVARAVFRSVGRDSVKVSGELDLPAGFDPADKRVTLEVEGATRDFQLDRSGRAKTGNGMLKLRIKQRRGQAFAGGRVRFKTRLVKGNYSAYWRNAGLANTDASHAPASMTVRMVVETTTYEGLAGGTYRCRKGKTGIFKGRR